MSNNTPSHPNLVDDLIEALKYSLGGVIVFLIYDRLLLSEPTTIETTITGILSLLLFVVVVLIGERRKVGNWKQALLKRRVLLLLFPIYSVLLFLIKLFS